MQSWQGMTVEFPKDNLSVEVLLNANIKRLGNVLPTRTRDNPNQGRVYDPSGISPSIVIGGGKALVLIYEGQNHSDRQTGNRS